MPSRAAATAAGLLVSRLVELGVGGARDERNLELPWSLLFLPNSGDFLKLMLLGLLKASISRVLKKLI